MSDSSAICAPLSRRGSAFARGGAAGTVSALIDLALITKSSPVVALDGFAHEGVRRIVVRRMSRRLLGRIGALRTAIGRAARGALRIPVRLHAHPPCGSLRVGHGTASCRVDKKKGPPRTRGPFVFSTCSW